MVCFLKRGCTSSFYKQRRQSFSLRQTWNYFFCLDLSLKHIVSHVVGEKRRWRQEEGQTSLKDLSLLRVFSRSWSTHSFLFCSSSFLFSRFWNRQQRETLRDIRNKVWIQVSSDALCQFGRIPLGCLAAIEIVPGGSDGAGWRGWSFARLATSSGPEPPHTGPGKYTKNTETSIVNSMQKHSWRLTRTEGWKLIGGQMSSLKSKKAMKWILEDGFKF